MALGAGGVGDTSGSSGNGKKKRRVIQTSGTPTSAVRKLTESHLHQITVLRAMAGQLPTSAAATTPPTAGSALHLAIDEISEVTKLDDEKEVQRILFILEGQKLVAPFPEGDFTSRVWLITRQGSRALKSIEKALVED